MHRTNRAVPACLFLAALLASLGARPSTARASEHGRPGPVDDGPAADAARTEPKDVDGSYKQFFKVYKKDVGPGNNQRSELEKTYKQFFEKSEPEKTYKQLNMERELEKQYKQLIMRYKQLNMERELEKRYKQLIKDYDRLFTQKQLLGDYDRLIRQGIRADGKQPQPR